MLIELINNIKQRTLFRNGHKIDLIITNPYLYHRMIISTGLMTINDDNNLIIELGNQVIRILNSDKRISLEDCNFHVVVVAIPQGQGGGKKIINLSKHIRTKKCITVINNDDNLCGARGIVTALTYHWTKYIRNSQLTNNEITYIRKGRNLQKDLAIKLLLICDIDIPEPGTGLTLEDIKNIEKKLDIQISIVCAENFNLIIQVIQGVQKVSK